MSKLEILNACTLKPTDVNAEAAEHSPLSPVLALEATRTFLGLALYLNVINRSLNEQGMWRASSHTGNYGRDSPSCSHKVVYEEVGASPASVPPSASDEEHCWSLSWY